MKDGISLSDRRLHLTSFSSCSSFPPLPDHIPEVDDWGTGGWRPFSLYRAFRHCWDFLRGVSCSSLYFPYGESAASPEHPVSFRAPHCCLARKTGYKTESTPHIFLCLQATAHRTAQPPIWKSPVHGQVTATQFPVNEPKTQQPQKASRIFWPEVAVQRWRIPLIGGPHSPKIFLPLRGINRENGVKFNSFQRLVKLIINSLISTYLLDEWLASMAEAPHISVWLITL